MHMHITLFFFLKVDVHKRIYTRSLTYAYLIVLFWKLELLWQYFTCTFLNLLVTFQTLDVELVQKFACPFCLLAFISDVP